MSISTCLSKWRGWIIVGATMLLVGGVIYYVRKKKIDSINTSPIAVNAIVESGLKDLNLISGRIRDRDRQLNETIRSTSNRTIRVAEGLRRAEERQREITELTNRARGLLAEIRAEIQ